MKKAFFAVLLVLILPFAASQSTQLRLSFTDTGELVVSHVYDDDATVGFLEVFVVSDSVQKKYSFENVLEGLVLPIDLDVSQLDTLGLQNDFSSSGLAFNQEIFLQQTTPFNNFAKTTVQNGSIYYNFFDQDGVVSNARFFVYATTPDFLPRTPTQTVALTHPLSFKSLTARKDESSNNFFVDVSAKGENVSSIEFYYSFLGSTIVESIPLSFSGNEFSATIGPFNGQLSLNSRLKVTDTTGQVYNYFFREKKFGFVAPSAQNTCEPIVFSKKHQEPKDTALLQSQTLSRLRIVEDESFVGANGERGFEALRVVDDDSSIEKVEFIVEDNGVLDSFVFENVSAGQVIPITASNAAKVYYNFMDSDGTQTNINFFLPTDKRSSLETSSFVQAETPSILEETIIEAIPSESCSSFSVKVTAKTSADAQKVFVAYGFDSTNLDNFLELSRGAGLLKPLMQTTPTLFLQEESDYEATIGPFESGTEFYANFYAENSEGSVDQDLGNGNWIGFAGQNLVEICGNFEDDDFDAEIDEGCLILPDLFFLDYEIPQVMVLGEQTTINATIKNSGLSGAQDFEVSLYFAGSLVETKTISALSENQETGVSFDLIPVFSDSSQVKIVIDPTNTVPELNELNNEAIETVSIGNNSLNLQLNYNDTFIVGDTRIIRVFDFLGNPQENALVFIKFPSNKTLNLTTNQTGFASFPLEEPGTYIINASKQGFEDFSGAFTVSQINSVFKNSYNLGEIIQLNLQTTDNIPIQDASVIITEPNGNRVTKTSSETLQLSQSGTYMLEFFRNNVKIHSTTLNVSGIVESLFVGENINDVLFGSVVKETPLFVILLFFSLVAAWFFYIKEKNIYPFVPKTSSQKRLESMLRVVVSILFFILPLQVSRFFGFNAGLFIAIIEILVVFLADFYFKNKQEKKAISLK